MTVDLTTERKIINSEVAKEIVRCRLCYSPALINVFSLGDLAVPRIAEEETALIAPLSICFCPECSLLQLRHTVDQSRIFNEGYPYETGVNPVMAEHVQELVSKTCGVAGVQDGDIIVAIGSNTGEELEGCEKDVTRVGFEPAQRVGLIAAERLIEKYGAEKVAMFLSPFAESTFRLRFGNEKAKVISSIANFYDFNDPNQEVASVKVILDPEGVLVVQQNYVVEMLKQKAFCNIVHEHLGYYSLFTMKTLLEKHGLEIFDVETNDINGGSFRIYTRHYGASVSTPGGMKRVEEMLQAESLMGLNILKTYEQFGKEIVADGDLVRGFLEEQKEQGMKIMLLGQSTRAGTRVQFWDLVGLLDGISERNPVKWGKKSLDIPIFSEEEARERADLMVVGIWFYGDAIIRREEKFLEKGGKLLFPSNNKGIPTLVDFFEGEIRRTPLRDYVKQ